MGIPRNRSCASVHDCPGNRVRYAPAARRPLLAYHGVLAPRARWRSAIVPPPSPADARAAVAPVSRRGRATSSAQRGLPGRRHAVCYSLARARCGSRP